MSKLDPKRLYEIFDLDHKSGKLTRKKNGRNKWSISNAGYYQVSVDGRTVPLHRVIWTMVNGREPAAEIDHIDGNRLNCRPANLREATRQQNCFNTRARKSNKSGLKGVSFCAQTGRYKAFIHLNYRTVYLGVFVAAKEAHEAYRNRLSVEAGKFGRSE
jgi:hypothetical protein